MIIHVERIGKAIRKKDKDNRITMCGLRINGPSFFKSVPASATTRDINEPDSAFIRKCKNCVAIARDYDMVEEK